MNITTSAKITNAQKQFLENESINFSKFVRQAIDQEINRSSSKQKMLMVNGVL